MKKLDIVYEDKELLVVNKETKVLTIATSKEKNHTLYKEASDYVKKAYPKNKVFIVNRLDRDTSGLVVFAKNEEVKKELQEKWNDITTREYIGIVEGFLKGSATLTSYLKEDKTFRVYSTKDKKGDYAITKYTSLASNKNYSLLKIEIKTGRKNQIRVQLSDIGHPIIGDKKYGSGKTPISRLGLHASYLKIHWHGKDFVFYTRIPKTFSMFEKEIKDYEDHLQKLVL